MRVSSHLKPAYLFAVDPSLTASGWALFSLSDGCLHSVGVLSPPGAQMVLVKRFEYLQSKIQELFVDKRLGVGDVLVCEGPAPLVRNPQSSLKVEGVRGIFETVARSFGVCVPGRLNPRTVQTELLGMRGKQLSRSVVKEWARETALRLYGPLLKELVPAAENAEQKNGEEKGIAKNNAREMKISQDIIDALLIGTVAVSRLQLTLKSGASMESAFVSQSQSRAGRGRNTGWREADVKKLFEI